MKAKMKKMTAVFLIVLTFMITALPVSAGEISYSVYTVSGTTYYLALRSEASYKASNEIAKLVNGEIVIVASTTVYNGDYWYVYGQKAHKWGYVNKNYLTKSSGYVANYYVTGTTYYLALRNAMAYDAANEIGKLKNGEKVQVLNSNMSNPDYWYVYAPTLDKYGYVNRNYLSASSSGSSSSSSSKTSGTKKTVTGTTYYLALRSDPSYKFENEIGMLKNGETVYVQKTGYGAYVYVYAPSLDKYGYVNANYLK